MTSREYTFRSTWRLAADPRDVYAALAALDEYPAWWPQVRRAERLGRDACALTIRAFLPLALRMVARAERRDPDDLVLEAQLTGDLVGRTRWSIVAHAGGAEAHFTEHVELNHPLAGRLAIARPALVANHALMMRRGEAGLRARLAGAR